MTFSISIFGGLSAYYAIYNAVASIFNNTGFINGLILVALMVSLIASVAQAAFESGTGGRMSVSLTHLGVLVILAMGFAGPKVTMNVTDKYTGNVRVIANVPMLAAFPAYLSNTVSEAVSDKLCTALSTVNGQYTCDSTKTFFSLPKVLLSPMAAQKSGLHPTAQNFANYMAECLSSDQMNTVRNTMNFLKARNGFHYDTIMAMPPSAGFVTWFAQAANGTITTSYKTCGDAATQLAADFSSLTPDSKILENGGAPQGSDATTYTDRVMEAYGSMIDAQKFYTQTILWAAESFSTECGALMGDTAAFSACTRGMNSQVFGWAMENAGNYSFIQTVLPESISYIQGVFIALTPLFLFFSLASGSRGIKTFITSFIFFIWVNTWYPTALVVDFASTAFIQDTLSTSSNANWPLLYKTLMTQVGYAGTMMSSVFILTFAVMTGNAMALSRVAGKLEPSDGQSFKQGAGHKDEMSVGARYDEKAAYAGNVESGGGFGRANAAPLSYSSRQSLSESSASAFSESQSARLQMGAAYSKAVDFIKSDTSGWKDSNTDAQDVLRMHQDRTGQAMSHAKDFAKSLGLNEAESARFQNEFGASVGAGIPMFASVQQAYKNATGRDMTKGQQQQFSDRHSDIISKDDSDAKSISVRAGHAFDRYTGADTKSSNSLKADLKQSMDRVQSADRKYEEAVRSENAAGADWSANEQQIGAMASGSALQLAKEAERSHQNDGAFKKAKDDHVRRLNRDFPLIENKDLLATMGALRQTGDHKAVAGIIQSLSNGPSPRSDLASGANKGVGADAGAIPSDPSKAPINDQLAQMKQTGQLPLGTPAAAAVAHRAPAGGAHPGAGGRRATGPVPAKPAAPGGNGGALSDLERRSQAQADKFLPGQDERMAQRNADAGSAPGAIEQGRDDIDNTKVQMTPEQIRDMLNLDNAIGMAQGAGLKWDEFEKEHPYLAFAAETALTLVIPEARAAGAILKFGKAAKAAAQGVKSGKQAVATAASEVQKLGKAIKKDSPLLGGKERIDMNAARSMGFKSEAEFKAAWSKANDALTGAEKSVLSNAKALAKELGGKDGDGALFVAGKVGKELKGVGRAAAPGAALEFSKYEASIYKQEKLQQAQLQGLESSAGPQIGGSGSAPVFGGGGGIGGDNTRGPLGRRSIFQQNNVLDGDSNGEPYNPFRRKK